jgi:hypothetical protein
MDLTSELVVVFIHWLAEVSDFSTEASTENVNSVDLFLNSFKLVVPIEKLGDVGSVGSELVEGLSLKSWVDPLKSVVFEFVHFFPEFF